MMILLATAEAISLLQIILNGGVPLILIVAVYFLGKFYIQEKESRSAETAAHAKQLGDLQVKFAQKVEDLYKERLESEAENARIIQRATEALESVNIALDKTNETLEALTDG